MRGWRRKVKSVREPSEQENFRHGGRSARDLVGIASRRRCYVMAEAMTRKDRGERQDVAHLSGNATTQELRFVVCAK
jgi:hypothetical protein